MKSLFTSTIAPEFQNQTAIATPISLHQLVSRLMDSFIPVAVNNHSFIINDVNPSLELKADEQVLAFVIGNMLTNAIGSSKKACIRVAASKSEAGIQISVRHTGASYYTTVANSFSQVMAAARSMGGNINIHNQRNEGTTITFYIGQK